MTRAGQNKFAAASYFVPQMGILLLSVRQPGCVIRSNAAITISDGGRKTHCTLYRILHPCEGKSPSQYSRARIVSSVKYRLDLGIIFCNKNHRFAFQWLSLDNVNIVNSKSSHADCVICRSASLIQGCPMKLLENMC